jgi:DNA invertase Pin-like site-specific DNA recombinase
VSKSKRVVIYTRVSTDGQSVENQRRELLAVVERRGWEVVQEYSDHGIGGALLRPHVEERNTARVRHDRGLER